MSARNSVPSAYLLSMTAVTMSVFQGSYAFWKVLDFFFRIPGPGKSWKITLVMESPGN